MPRIILVSNRLPVTLRPERPPPGDVELGSGGLASALAGAVQGYGDREVVWIGWPGCVVKEDEQQRWSARMNEVSPIRLLPVWLSQSDVDDFYTGFANSSLWPVLHWMTTYARFRRSWAEAYRRVNEQVADVILKQAKATSQDLIWIQDYHFFLVPQILRKKRDYKMMHDELQKSGLIQRPEHLPPPLDDSTVDEFHEASGAASLPEHAMITPEAGYADRDLRVFQSPMEGESDVFLSLEHELDTHDGNGRRQSGRLKRRTTTQVELATKLKIAVFLHCPFPTYEVLCVLPQCVDVVEGVLGADLVGFQTYNYLRHFRSCVTRLCGLMPEIDYVDHRGHRTKLGVYPMGANVRGIQEAMKTDKFVSHLTEYTEQLEGKSVVLNVERLDYSKGVPQKLAAIERYLEDAGDKEVVEQRVEDLQKRFERLDNCRANRGLATSNLRRVGQTMANMLRSAFNEGEMQSTPTLLDHSKTVFVFITVPSRRDVDEYKNIEEEVNRKISEINGRFSTMSHQPIIYIHRSMPIEELAALFARADCCLVTPLIDGMNLVSKEFIAAKDRAVENVVPGTVILSELAGAAQELFDAIVVNPYDEEAVADAISIGLELTRRHLDQDQDLRWEATERMRQAVIENDSCAWARKLLSDLESPSKGSRIARTESMQMQPLEDFTALRFSASSPGIKGLFLDYDGTLREFENSPEAAIPSEDTLNIFESFDKRQDLKVFIVSGRPREFLEKHFGRFASLTLIAEHGFFKRGPDTDSKWVPFTQYMILDWMEKIRPVMEMFTRCTPGSHIEEKTSAMVWHYRDSDEEYGQFKAKELMHQLAVMLNNLPCQISQGQKIVEVASLTVKKGIVVSKAIQEQQTICGPFSELLICGDDRTDESMFLEAPSTAWTVKVGPGETAARHRLSSPAELRQFLAQVAKQSTPDAGEFSTSPVNHARFFSAREEKLNLSSEEIDGDPLDCLPETEEGPASS